jgi:biotin carboxylase
MGAQKKIFVACPTPRDIKELPRIVDYNDYQFIYQDYVTENLERLIYEDGSEEGRVDDIPAMIDALIAEYSDGSLAGIISSDDYPGINIASAVAQRLGLASPSPEVILQCQHKYYSRCLQKKFVPEAVPQFALLDMHAPAHTQKPVDYPFFLKPVKSVFSCFAQSIASPADLEQAFKNKLPNTDFFIPFNQLLKRYTNLEHDAHHMISEELLGGHQVTVEGYVFKGEVGFFGVVDSVMFPGTICFQRFEYPSQLTDAVQDRMKDIARRCMKGIGLDNGLFNIEMFYNPAVDTIHIIEINPRMAGQFADLYEKVDGSNSYEALVSIAVGKKPVLKKKEGEFKVAASFVLREFENKWVEKVPDAQQIKKAHEQFPELRVEIFAEEGKPLSSTLQDGKSYRYGLIHLGADSWSVLEEKFQKCKQILEVTFRI